MKTEIIRLHFWDGLHIGRGAEELDKTATTYGSDALKSALYATGLPWYPHWAQYEKAFFEGFCISSAFPYCEDDYFLPKPAGMRFDFEEGNDLTEAKLAKKITYISSDVFKQWALEPSMRVTVSEKQIGDGSFLFKRSDAKKFLHTTIQQRVAVPIEGGDSRPYYFERLFFEKDCGLYFIVRFNSEDIRPQILHALRLLGDAGIGTDRTVGNGQFVADEPVLFTLPEGTEQGLQFSFGLYLPTKEEITQISLGESYWALIRRGGFIASSENDALYSIRKNNIYFFTEGSAFKAGHSLKGKYVDLQPDLNMPDMHPIWRCGMPIFTNL